MAVNVKTSSNTINVKVGQADAIKVLSSAAGASGGTSDTAKNVIGGIGSITALDVSGITTLGITSVTDTLYVAGITTVAANGGITTTGGDFYTGGNLFIGGALSTNDLNVSGIATFGSTSVVIDGDNDLINVGTALTLGSGEGVLTPSLLVSGISTFNQDVQFPGAAYNILWDQATSKFKFDDSAQLVFGSASGGDMKLFHQSGNSTIRNETGQFRIAGNDIRIQTQNHSEDYILCTDGGAVQIFFNDNEKFATTKEGVLVSGGTTTGTLSVTGVSTLGVTSATNLTAQQLNVSGVSTFSGASLFSSGVTINGFGDFAASTFNNVRAGWSGDGEIDTSSGNLTLDSAGGTVIVDDALTVVGNTGIGSLNVSGISTFNDIVYITENTVLRFGTNKQIKGDANTLKIQGFGGQDVEINSNAGGGTSGDTLFKSNDTTLLTLLGTGNVSVGTHFSVAGVSTFTGIVTTSSDLYVGGDLYVQDDLVLDEITSRNLNITGLSTFVGNAQFDSNVTIGGTLTYEDVTNVDSIGIITAGKGLRATAGGLVVTAGISTFGGATFSGQIVGTSATFTSDAFVDGTLTAGLIDGGSY